MVALKIDHRRVVDTSFIFRGLDGRSPSLDTLCKVSCIRLIIGILALINVSCFVCNFWSESAVVVLNCIVPVKLIYAKLFRKSPDNLLTILFLSLYVVTIEALLLSI